MKERQAIKTVKSSLAKPSDMVSGDEVFLNRRKRGESADQDMSYLYEKQNDTYEPLQISYLPVEMKQGDEINKRI